MEATTLHGSAILALATALSSDVLTAVIFVDRTGVIRAWNRGAERLFGHAASAAIGKRADLVVPHQYREAHWKGFARAMASPWRGAEGWGPIEALHKDETLVPLEVFLTPVGGRGVMGLFRRRAGG
jgi:PAS domain S-box-containing protein